MKNYIRYLVWVLLAMVCDLSVSGQEFDPASPAEPGRAPTRLDVVAVPAEGGTVSGGGRFVPDAMVAVRATAKANFVFLNWTNEQGEVVSTDATYSLKKGEGSEVLTANFGFRPGSPNEPTEIVKNVYYTLSLQAGEGGSVSGGGRYLPGQQVRVSASCNTGFVFDGWFDPQGERLSASASYRYTTTAGNVLLTARFRYDPASPSEPSTPDIRPKHDVTATATEGGTVNTALSRLMEGQSLTLTASKNTGYDFVGWYLDGVLYTTLSSFSYTVGSADAAFEARFAFNPSSPSEPQMSADKRFSFYLMNHIGKPGDTVQCTLYLTSLEAVGDMTFQLTFPERLKPDMEKVLLSAKAVGYELSYTETNDTTFVLSAIGGETPAGSTLLMSFDIAIPADFPTGESHQVKINQVSVTDTSGAGAAASTRNGRVSVYQLGDTNGDNVVNTSDVLNMVTRVLNRKTDVFIEEVSDMNDDHTFNSSDVFGIVQIVLNK